MKYMKLDQKGNAMAEYIWIDAFGGVRSKSKVGKSHGVLARIPNIPWREIVVILTLGHADFATELFRSDSAQIFPQVGGDSAGLFAHCILSCAEDIPDAFNKG
jgi:hypothetical protein